VRGFPFARRRNSVEGFYYGPIPCCNCLVPCLTMESILRCLQVLVSFFRAWDRLVDLFSSAKNVEWRFREVVVPTEFDAISPTTALLWLCRNVAPEIVWAGVVGGVILGLVLVCVVGAISVYLGFSCCGRTGRVRGAESATRIVIAPLVEKPNQTTLTPVWRPRLLFPSVNQNALTDQECREYALAMRGALRAAHLSIQALLSEEPSSQDVSGVVELD